jgi:hypothetical protein
MDVLFFLQVRTKFTRAFYKEALFPFQEIKRKIEAREDPFVPLYDEDGEPPFLEEWLTADDSIDILGQACVSMLSSSLHLYLKESVNNLLATYSLESLKKAGIGRPGENKAAFKKGWFNGYRNYFLDQLGIDWTKGPSNLSLLEEIVLTRNRAQHPESIASLRIESSYHDAAKYHGFFADDLEMKLLGDDQAQDGWIQPWRLNVTTEKLMLAIDEVDRFCSRLQDELVKWPSQLKQSPA